MVWGRKTLFRECGVIGTRLLWAQKSQCKSDIFDHKEKVMNKETRIKILEARIQTLMSKGLYNINIVHKLQRQLRKLQPIENN